MLSVDFNGTFVRFTISSLHPAVVVLPAAQVDRKVLEEAFVRFGELKTATLAPK